MASRTRAALYHRVSTVDQNPHAARKELHAAARRLGLRVTLDVRETGSGANNQRPGLIRVLHAVQGGEVDTVLVWKLDRCSTALGAARSTSSGTSVSLGPQPPPCRNLR